MVESQQKKDSISISKENSAESNSKNVNQNFQAIATLKIEQSYNEKEEEGKQSNEVHPCPIVSFTQNSIKDNNTNDIKFQKEIIINKNESNLNNIDKIKENQSSFEVNSNEGSNSRSKIYRTIDVNPYKNLNIVKKFFVYQLKKKYLKIKDNPKVKTMTTIKSAIDSNMVLNSPKWANFNKKKSGFSPMNCHEVLSTFSKIAAGQANKFKIFDDYNIQINDYYIYRDKIIARGKNHIIYLTLDLNTNIYYAVRVENKIRIKQKKAILKRLHYKYIVEINEIIETENEIYIFMEYLSVYSLKQKLLSIDMLSIWKYFRNLVSAVEYCHEVAKVVHCSIGLNNCLLDSSETLKLSNFSYSQILFEDSPMIKMSNNTEFIGVVPPEIAFSLKEEIIDGKEYDIWLMGNILYTLVFKRGFILKERKNLTIQDYSIDNIIFNEDLELENLLKFLLHPDPVKRFTIEDVKDNKWITKDEEFPMPDVQEEALEYCYRLTSEKIDDKKAKKED